MRRILLAASALLLASTFVAAQAPKVDMTGKWLFSVTTDNGTGTPTLTFKQTGDSLTGHYSSQVFGEVDFTGTSKNGMFKFAFTVSGQGQAITITYSGTIESIDAVKGTVDLGGFGTGTFTGTRQRPPGASGTGEVSSALALKLLADSGSVRISSPSRHMRPS